MTKEKLMANLTQEQREVVDKLLAEKNSSEFSKYSRMDEITVIAYVEAFKDYLSELSLNDFEDRYWGYAESKESFVWDNIGQDMPELVTENTYIKVDIESTYNELVPYGFVEFAGFYFYNY